MEWKIDEWPDEQARPATGTAERELVPEGRHRFEIVRASEEGPKLKLALAVLRDGQPDKRFAWVWCNTPRDQDWGRRLVASLARGLGIGPAAWNSTAVADLEGRQLEAEIYHKQAGDRLFVNVGQFFEAGAVPVEQPKPVKKPAAAPVLAEDDIPF